MPGPSRVNQCLLLHSNSRPGHDAIFLLVHPWLLLGSVISCYHFTVDQRGGGMQGPAEKARMVRY